MISVHHSTTRAVDLLDRWLSQRIAPDSLVWLNQKRQQIAETGSDRDFFTAFSAVPRYTGKRALQLAPEDLQAAEATQPGWLPSDWSVDQAARTLLLLTLPQNNAEVYLGQLDRVFAAADVGELVALYQALPLLPHPDQHQRRAAEGIRSNITAVFNAVALQNSYPADYLDTPAWNQMVLKALFVGSPLHLIQGLDRRANPELARMAVDYAHERWAANRVVSPELWRLVGRFASAKELADLEKVLASSDPVHQTAALLACAQSNLPQAAALLDRYPHRQASICRGDLTWNNFHTLLPFTQS